MSPPIGSARAGVVSQIGNTIPDSGDLHARYDATSLSLNDGDAVSTWTDETGNGYDLTAGDAPTFKTSIINGNPIIRFNGSSNYLDVDFSDLPQPNTVYIVAQSQKSSVTDFDEIIDGFDGTVRNNFNVSDDGFWSMFAGTVLESSTSYDNSPHIFGIFFDTTNSDLRYDGTNIVSGNVGSDAMGGITVGSTHNQATFAAIDIGEILIYPQDKGNIYFDIESYLSNKWGITI